MRYNNRLWKIRFLSPQGPEGLETREMKEIRDCGV